MIAVPLTFRGTPWMRTLTPDDWLFWYHFKQPRTPPTEVGVVSNERHWSEEVCGVECSRFPSLSGELHGCVPLHQMTGFFGTILNNRAPHQQKWAWCQMKGIGPRTCGALNDRGSPHFQGNSMDVYPYTR